MAKKKQRSSSVSAIRREIKKYQTEHKRKKGKAGSGQRQILQLKIKLLRSVQRILDDFFGDPNIK